LSYHAYFVFFCQLVLIYPSHSYLTSLLHRYRYKVLVVHINCFYPPTLILHRYFTTLSYETIQYESIRCSTHSCKTINKKVFFVDKSSDFICTMSPHISISQPYDMNPYDVQFTFAKQLLKGFLIKFAILLVLQTIFLIFDMLTIILYNQS